MSSKRKKYKVNNRAKKALCFFVVCKANPATKVKVIEAMWVRGYSNPESADLMLQMHMHRTIQMNGKARQEPKRGHDQSPNTVPFPG
jgi:hypothetical protein